MTAEKWKIHSDTRMFRPPFLALIILSGVTVAYLMSYQLPFLLYFLSAKRQLRALSVGDTSLVLRVRQKNIPANLDLQKEALTAMNLALDMDLQGKHNKALKLFQHALNLDPMHADILTYYGEFLEKHEKDITKAEHFYRKALFVCPNHSRALVNRERVLPIVEEIDQTMYNQIDKKLNLLYKVPQNHPGLRRMKKEAYFLHIYHTNAIEGNTLTLSQTRAIVETRIAVGGKSLVEQNEVLGLDAALSYINSTLLGKVGSLTLEDILEIHRRVLGYVDLIEAGRIRTTQVFVGDFTPPASKEVPQLMDDFIDWLNSREALQLHPIEYAALAHYKLVIIHPFYDGNGRTSRLLMNLILMQAGFPPVTIKVEDRHIYYNVLQQANEGDIHPFIRFIAECTESTLDEFLLASLDNAASVIPQLSVNKTRSERITHIENTEKDNEI
ncbi:hypothetical protein CHS0354_022125 [Potamilus streckersoni]|uniref:protein adenylyltransferase n=1 Tax=Potamilus streckersoni TaxID=2493646 RepID=A0AAE0VIH0_9BIVA|nr:hypothetical protein CHS0354_022125 [Potamilus streckersoni]